MKRTAWLVAFLLGGPASCTLSPAGDAPPTYPPSRRGGQVDVYHGTKGGKPRVLLDPNKWSKDGTVALSGQAVSDGGKYLAYGVAEAGSDWNTWHVLEVATGEKLGDEVKWVKFSEPAWTRDGKGFFYSRYDEPRGGARFHSLNLNQKLFYHRVGTRQADDVL